jgi:hypothetical protein
LPFRFPASLSAIGDIAKAGFNGKAFSHPEEEGQSLESRTCATFGKRRGTNPALFTIPAQKSVKALLDSFRSHP